MLSPSLKKSLESKSKYFQQKNKEILDILLFGSALKGKENIRDLDLLMIFKEKKSLELMYQFRKLLEPLVKVPVEITGKSYPELFQEGFLAKEALLSESYSLIFGKCFSEGLGFKSQFLFNYALKGKSKSERMRFYYSLYGRNGPGMLEKLKAIKFAETVLLCPVESKEPMKEFLLSWKIEFRELPVLMPKRML